jgi:hypothetical protein
MGQRMNWTHVIALLPAIVITPLACSQEAAGPDEAPLPVLVANDDVVVDPSDHLVVGAYDDGELRLGSDFSHSLGEIGEGWVARVGAAEHAIDLADASVALAALGAGDTLELVAEDADGLVATVVLQLGEPRQEGVVPSPPLEPAGCFTHCYDYTQARYDYAASPCNSQCGVGKRLWGEQKRTCNACMVECNGHWFTVTYACGGWYSSGLTWCDYC